MQYENIYVSTKLYSRVAHMHLPVYTHSICTIIMLSSVACLALSYFSTLPLKWHIFHKKKIIEHKICFLISSTACLAYSTFYEEFSEILSQMSVCSHVKHPLFLSDFKSNFSFCHKFLKNPQTLNFMKICQVETKIFHVARKT